MKRRDLEKELHRMGWYLKRHGAKHDIWTNGIDEQTIPRHKEIREYLARSILKEALKNVKASA